MNTAGIASAVLSVSTPGTTFLPDSGAAAAPARGLNDFSAEPVAARPEQFGFVPLSPTTEVSAGP